MILRILLISVTCQVDDLRGKMYCKRRYPYHLFGLHLDIVISWPIPIVLYKSADNERKEIRTFLFTRMSPDEM